jgi:cellulose synthase operon protein C
VTRALLAALLLATTAACGNSGGTPADMIARGQAALKEGQPRTARIEFLNAIKADPDNARLRLLQAETYLALGDGVAAEAELRRAAQLGTPAAEMHHLQAHALQLQGKNEEALAEAAKAPPAHAARAARVAGLAQGATGNVAAATEAFDRALRLTPNDADLWLDVARFRRSVGNVGGAIQATDAAVKLRPGHADALTLRGELTRGQYGMAAALAWFDRALEIDPANVTARLEKAATLGDMGRMRDMLAETRTVLVQAPNHPMAYYLQSMLAARARKFELARSLYQRTNGALDAQPAGMMLASAIDFQTGNVEQAVARLEKVVSQQPGNAKARRLLAAAQVRRGDAAGAVETLRPLADRGDADSYTLTLMGQALQKQGDADAAARYFARAAQPQNRAQSALLATAVDAQQLEAMRKLAAARPDDPQPQVALIGGLLSRGQSDEALQRARVLQAKHSGVPDVHTLVGDALGVRGDFAGAAREYQKAANLQFSEPVAIRLVEALRRSNQSPAAARVLQLYLEQNPRNAAALLMAANGHMEAGNWPQAIRIYEGLRSRLGDRDAALLNNLAWAYGEQRQYDRAIPLAEKAWGLDRNNPATADTLGWLLFKSGKDKARGLALIERAARGAPDDAAIRAHLQAAKGA